MTQNVTGELGGPISGLGYFALGISDWTVGGTWPNSWIQGFDMVTRNFTKTTYGRFFSYKTTPRVFTFQADRLSRESLDASPYVSEIGKGETLLWKFDFSNVVLPAETITGTPTFTVYLKRQKINIPNVTSSPGSSGAIANVTMAGSALQIGGLYTIICSVPLSSSRTESCVLDFSCPL